MIRVLFICHGSTFPFHQSFLNHSKARSGMQEESFFFAWCRQPQQFSPFDPSCVKYSLLTMH